MKLNDFKIGLLFRCGGYEWRCTDIGTRTVAAIFMDRNKDLSWFHGPPYAVPEEVFDESDIEACEPIMSTRASTG